MQQPGSHLSLAPEPDEQPEATAAQPVAGFPPVELPPERRLSWSTLAALAAACGLAAVVLGAGAVLWPGDGSAPTAAATAPDLERAVALLADPAVARVTFAGSLGRIVLLAGGEGDALLVLNGLGAAPAGRVYRAWVTEPGPGETLPAAVFDGTGRLVPLTEPVPPGAQVSVTLEDEGGADAPSRAPRLYAVRPPSQPGS